MAKNKISEFDVNPANNTDINSINIAEGCAPSGINNAIRQLMSDLKEFQTGAAGDSFTVGGAFAANGGATLGDASGDALTINSSAVSIPNGLNFDSNTLVVDATNNNVGIGTSSPATKLQVTDSVVGITYPLTLNNPSATTNGRGVGFTLSGGSGNIAQIAGFYDGTDQNLSFSSNGSTRFATAGTERMRLDSSGNLGLGVTPSAWTGKAIQIGIGASFIGSPSFNFTDVGNNIYGNYSYLTTGAASFYRQFEGSHLWYNAPSGTAGNAITFTQAMTLNASGNLGIGTSSPNFRLQLNTATASGAQYLQITNGSTGSAAGDGMLVGVDTNNEAIVWMQENAALKFGSNNTERMRIDSSGTLLVGTSASIRPSGFGTFKQEINASGQGLFIANIPEFNTGLTTKPNANATYFAGYFLNSSETAVGFISVTNINTAYSTSSDYRLKNNQAPLTGSGAFIDALKPKTWAWTIDGSTGVGFIAHEVQEVSPSSVYGEKDAVDENGNPKYQGMEYGSAEFIANIIAELQDLRKRVSALETK